MFAVIESVAFKIKQIWDTFGSQHLCPNRPIIRICGGVSKNDFVCQQISSLIGHPVERIDEPDFCSARGTALLSGLSAGKALNLSVHEILVGLWTFDDIAKSEKINKRFEPKANFDMSRYKQC